MRNLVYFIKTKNEKDRDTLVSSSTNDSRSSTLDAYSEKIINDLLNGFSKIKKNFEAFNSLTNSIERKFEILPNNEKNFGLELNLNPKISKSNFNFLNFNNNFLDEIFIGNLIPLKCGHNGFYSYDERNLIKDFIKKNNFLLQ